jgi:hypothetical protein
MLTTVAAVAAAVLCCAGPVALISGAAAGLGSVLRNPVLIAVGAALLLCAAWYALGHRFPERARGRFSRLTGCSDAGESAPCCSSCGNSAETSRMHGADRPDSHYALHAKRIERHNP